MRSFLIQIPNSVKFQLSTFKQFDCRLDTLEKLCFFARKITVEVSACSVG